MAGLARDDIRQALDQADCDWSALALQTLTKRFKVSADTPTLHRKQQQFLYARGFESRDIEAALGGDGDTASI